MDFEKLTPEILAKYAVQKKANEDRIDVLEKKVDELARLVGILTENTHKALTALGEAVGLAS